MANSSGVRAFKSIQTGMFIDLYSLYFKKEQKMATVIDKLLKGYSVKEIEEILFKPAFELNKHKKKNYIDSIKPAQYKTKRIMMVSN